MDMAEKGGRVKRPAVLPGVARHIDFPDAEFDQVGGPPYGVTKGQSSQWQKLARLDKRLLAFRITQARSRRNKASGPTNSVGAAGMAGKSIRMALGSKTWLVATLEKRTKRQRSWRAGLISNLVPPTSGAHWLPAQTT
jgi:hypothetical protein